MIALKKLLPALVLFICIAVILPFATRDLRDAVDAHEAQASQSDPLSLEEADALRLKNRVDEMTRTMTLRRLAMERTDRFLELLPGTWQATSFFEFANGSVESYSSNLIVEQSLDFQEWTDPDSKTPGDPARLRAIFENPADTKGMRRISGKVSRMRFVTLWTMTSDSIEDSSTRLSESLLVAEVSDNNVLLIRPRNPEGVNRCVVQLKRVQEFHNNSD